MADIKKIKGFVGDTFKLMSHFIVSFSGNKLSESNAAKSIRQALEKSSAQAKIITVVMELSVSCFSANQQLFSH